MTASHASNGLAPEKIIERIKRALARDKTHTFEDVVALLQTGAAQIFWNDHGAWITEIITAPSGRRWLNIWVVAGELPGVMDLQPQVIEHARKNDCPHLTATARFGWKHVAKAHGWKQHAMIITHEVPNSHGR